MKREFSFYEFVAVIVPGVLFLFTLTLVFPGALNFLGTDELSLGDVSLFVILSYAVGHLIQAIGNVIEELWWKLFGGLPTSWPTVDTGCCAWVTKIRDRNFPVICEARKKKLPAKIVGILGGEAKPPADYDKDEWFDVTRAMYAAVARAKSAGRIDIFNGNYGLFRGIAAAFITAAVIVLIASGVDKTGVLVVLAAGSILALCRMHLFAKQYARELFVQFLLIPETATPDPSEKEDP